MDDVYDYDEYEPAYFYDEDDDEYNKNVVTYLDKLGADNSDLFHWCHELATFYKRKLWHNISLCLEDFIRIKPFTLLCDDALIQLYHNFIIHIETKINLLKLAYFAIKVSCKYQDNEAAISYLEGVNERLQATKMVRIEEPLVYIRMQIALLTLGKRDRKECKNLLDNCMIELDGMTNVDPSIYAHYYWVLCEYHKSGYKFAEFYKSGCLYLSFLPLEPELEDSESQKHFDLAVDLSLSALLGENIYNFGELLLHPIIQKLLESPAAWLYSFLEAFNSGDLVRYQHLCDVHRESLSAQPALMLNEKKLLEKLNILCLMDIIYRRLEEDRTIPLIIITEGTKLCVEDVEYLLMKSLSVHLIEGIIDQIDGTVYVSWVKPRVLGMPLIRDLKHRLDNWIDKVKCAIMTMKADLPDISNLIVAEGSTGRIPLYI